MESAAALTTESASGLDTTGAALYQLTGSDIKNIIKPQSIEMFDAAIAFASEHPDELADFGKMMTMIKDWTERREVDDMIMIKTDEDGASMIKVFDKEQAEEVHEGGQKGGAVLKCSSWGFVMLICMFMFVMGISSKMTGYVGGKMINDFIRRILDFGGDEWTIVWIRAKQFRIDLVIAECQLLSAWFVALGVDLSNAETAWATLHGKIIMGIVNWLRKICIIFGLTELDRTEELTKEESDNKKAVDDAFSLTKVNVKIGTNFADYTLDQLVEIITEGKIPNTQASLTEIDFNACQAGILKAIKMGKATLIANPKLKVEYEKIAQQKTITISGEVDSNEALTAQILAIADRRPPASNSSSSNRASASPSARANKNSITNFFQPANKGPGGAPGGGGRRSRRRMCKSKHGGRSRMRKMRTKKRRMSKRKYRR